MFFFKSCRRCQGDMRLEKDLMGRGYVHCLNCGYTLDVPRRRFVRNGRSRSQAAATDRKARV